MNIDEIDRVIIPCGTTVSVVSTFHWRTYFYYDGDNGDTGDRTYSLSDMNYINIFITYLNKSYLINCK